MPDINPSALSRDRLKNAAGQMVFDRGEAYFQWGRVKIDEVTSQRAICFVQGNHLYEVEITIDQNYLYLRCECPYATKGVVCKHEVAAALAVGDYLRKNLPPHWSEQLNQALQAPKAGNQRGGPRPYLLFFSLQNNANSYYESWNFKPYMIPTQNLPESLKTDPQAAFEKSEEEILESASMARTPFNTLNPKGCVNCGIESVVLANMMIERVRNYSYTNTSLTLGELLALSSSIQAPIFLGDESSPMTRRLEFLSQPCEMRLLVERGETGVQIRAKIVTGEYFQFLDEMDIQILPTTPTWILVGNQLLKLADENQRELLSSWIATPQVFVPSNEEEEFLEKFYLRLAQQTQIEGEGVAWENDQSLPVSRLYLSESKGALRADLRFGYGEYELPYESTKQAESVVRKPESWTLVRVQRQPEIEEQCFRALSTSVYRLKRAPKPARAGIFSLRANAHPVDFLLHSVPRLIEAGYEIYGEERLKTIHVNRNKPKLSFNISSGIDWFDVQTVVNFGELEVSLKELRKAVRRNQRYIKLADGSIGEIPEEWIERYKHLFGLSEETENGLRLSQSQLTIIDQLLQGAENVRADTEFKRLRDRLRDFSGISPVNLPKGFHGVLPSYQKAGYDWLHFLHDFRFGGCLADDMGLGKTVQVLVFLQSLREGLGSKTSDPPQHADLLVVPRSLLVNWQREAARFTPGLRILEYFETNREKELLNFDQYDLVITTYGIMLRDIEKLREYTFNYALSDESQAIKNPLAQTSKAARLLRSRHRLVLTGTPVENSTVDLWSQFAFLNPGLLGSLEYFKKEFSLMIEKKRDEKTAQLLQKIVHPFILRRSKTQVAPELPPRSERILFCDMEPAQRKFYNRTRDYYRGFLLGMIDKEGLSATRMKILEGLLRLRQIANHPRLVDSKFRGDSTKFELLLETLETLRTEDHKALVFSQFVQMLRLVRQPLDERKIPYAYLDGHTQNRQERVDAFQNSADIPFFLISLRAGGVGLNLTAADYVIHIDPWWNPAVEMQATDRTHRIGQDKPVFVYKLITRDSVEEKILQLQEQKKNLVNQLITSESGFFKSLTPQDVNDLFS